MSKYAVWVFCVCVGVLGEGVRVMHVGGCVGVVCVGVVVVCVYVCVCVCVGTTSG